MGTDIHCYLERKTKSGWVVDPGHTRTVAGDVLEIQSLAGRNYTLFSLIAGVRGQHQSMFPVRGLPKNVSDDIKAEYEKDHYHSATYLSPNELKRIMSTMARLIREYYADFPFGDLTGSANAAFSEYGCNDGILRYIRSYKESEQVDNILLGTKNNTRFRIVIWFDS